MVKNLLAVWETQVQSLDQEDPLEKENPSEKEDCLEKGMATNSSILSWRIPWTERLADYSPLGCKVSDMN